MTKVILTILKISTILNLVPVYTDSRNHCKLKRFNDVQSLQFNKFTKILIIIVCALAVMTIDGYLGSGKAQQTATIAFNETNLSERTINIFPNNQTLPTAYATIRHSLKLEQSHVAFSIYINGKSSTNHIYGNWVVSVGNERFCTTGVTYHCTTVRFEPKSSILNAIPLGTTITYRFIYKPPGGYDEINLHFVRTDLNMNWRSDSSGVIVDSSNSNDSFESQYADVVGYFDNESELNFELWIQKGIEKIEKYTLTKNEVYSSWSGTEWNYNSTYGEWLIQSFSDCPSSADSSKCSQVLFRPNRTNINGLFGKVTMWLRGTRTQNDLSHTDILKFNINGQPSTSFVWDSEGSETIKTGNQLEYSDLFGETTIFKQKGTAVTVDAIERLNQNSQSFDEDGGSSESVGDFLAFPLGLEFKYGNWFVEEGFDPENDPHNELFHSANLRFAFRPNSTEINNNLNTDELITSTLNFHIHQGDDSTPKIATTSITVTIDRSSIKPILSITSKTNSVIEGQLATFTITSNFDPMQPFLVSYIPTNSSGDFLDSTSFPSGLPQFENLTFSQVEGSDAWTDEISINLREADGIDADDGSITVTLNTATEYAFYFAAAEPNNSVTIKVEDAEKPTLSFQEESVSITEEDVDKNVELTLNLSETIEDTVDVSYEIVGKTATEGTDFVDISNGSVTFLPNTTSIPFNIQIKGDDLSEGDETFKVIISTPPSNAYFRHGNSTLEAEVTIHDDEPIKMNVATTDFKVTEDVINGNFIVEVVLSKTALIANPNTPIPEPVSFLVETNSGTATIDADFKTPDRQPTEPRFKIPADAKTFSFAIPILNDIKNEGNETFNVRIHDLQQATFADGTTEQTLVLTIIDNEKPTLSFMQNTKTIEEEDSDTNVELILNLSGPIDEAVDISYEVIAESAIADTDFVDSGDGVVSIASNTTSIPISIQIKGDDINEGNETFKVRVTAPPDNAVFADGVSMLEATIKIIDDESPALSIDRSTLTISERAEMTHIRLTLSGPASNDVIVTYSTSITRSDTALQEDFTTQSASTITISSSPPATSGLIQIPINNDTDEEEDETFTLTLTEISGAVFANDQSSIVLQVTIIDDEGLPILSIDSNQIAVNEQNGYAEVDLSFIPAITEPVTIVYSTIQDTAVGGVDYTIQTNATLEIATGNKETIFIPITNDNIYEGEEKFSMEISAIQGAAYGSGVINTPIMITITDDETEPTITISAYSCEYGEPIPTNFSVNESAGNLIFNAKLSHPSQNPVIFNYSATADTATGADFYVSNATQYTIQPGSICTEIVTPITHDILFEEDEQFNVTFTSDTGTDIIPAFKVKIEDDDVAIWSIEDLAMNEGDSDTEMAFRVYLSTPVYQTVRVKWTASTIAGNTATFGEDYAAVHNSYTGYVTVLAGRIEGSIAGIEITGDTIFEPDETFTITLSDPEEGTQIGDGVAIGTINNDDPEPTLSVSTISQVNGN